MGRRISAFMPARRVAINRRRTHRRPRSVRTHLQKRARMAVLIWIMASGGTFGFVWVKLGGIGGAFVGGSTSQSAWTEGHDR